MQSYNSALLMTLPDRQFGVHVCRMQWANVLASFKTEHSVRYCVQSAVNLILIVGSHQAVAVIS